MKLKKILKTVLIVIIAAVVLLVVFANASFKLPVLDYYKMAKGEFKIPDINSGFIPQGLSYDKDIDAFYATGYAGEGKASPIYVIDRESGKTLNKILMANPDGSIFDGHCGGISIYHDKLYVAGGFDECLYVFDAGKVREAEYGSSVSYESVVDLKTDNDGVGIAFTAVYDDILYAGEFYREQNYPTRESHYVDCADGTNKALAIAISMDEDGKASPLFAISLPDQAQGMCITDETIYLSTSYGTKFSHILEYENKVADVINDNQNGSNISKINVLDKEVPLYILDSAVLKKDNKIAPMSEEMDIVDGKMYIMCESASNKYIFGKLLGAEKCYAIRLDEDK